MNKALVEKFLIVLSPFAPHLAEELWARLGHGQSLAYEPWPQADASLLVEDTVEIVVQVNGKVRGRVRVPVAAAQDVVSAAARNEASVAGHLAGKTVRKEIFVAGRLLNIVVS